MKIGERPKTVPLCAQPHWEQEVGESPVRDRKAPKLRTLGRCLLRAVHVSRIDFRGSC